MRIKTDELRRHRLAAGLSLRALAVAAGVAHDTVMDVEAGKREPQAATVKKLADVLNVTVADLVDWKAEGLPAVVAGKGTAALVAA